MLGPFSSRHIRRTGSPRRQKGGVVVLFAICLIVLIGAVGLAIDSAMAYSAKARLSLAADSAVLAAADVYQKDTDPATREQHAREAASAYFAANYPRGFLGTTHTLPNLQISEGPHGTDFQYSARTNSPLTLGRVLSAKILAPTTSPVVRLNASVKRSDVDLVIIMDESEIISTAYWRDVVVPSIISNYVDNLDPSRSRLALLTSGFSCYDLRGSPPLVPFDLAKRGFDKGRVVREIKESGASYGHQDRGSRCLAKAMVTAADQLSKVAGDDSQKILLVINTATPEDVNMGPSGTGNGKMLRISDDLQKKGVDVYAFEFGNSSMSWSATSLPADVIINGTKYFWPTRDIIACLSGDKNAGAPRHPEVCPVAEKSGSRYCESEEATGMSKCLLDISKDVFTTRSVLIE